MGIEENKEVVKQLIEKVNKGDISALREHLTSNFVAHQAGSPDIDRDTYIEHALSRLGMIHTIDDMLAEGDKVFTRFTVRFPHEPSGNTITAARFIVVRIEDGKLAESWSLADKLGAYQQMGLLPPTEEPVSEI